MRTVWYYQISGREYGPFDSAKLRAHAYMAAIPSLSLTGKERNLAVAEKCLVAFGVEGKLASSTLVEVGNRFEEWIMSTFPNAKRKVEVPVTAGRVEGGAWNGTLDLILELPDGKLVVIDHKSTPIRGSNCESKALQYVGQLAAYEKALTSLGYTVDSTWIHFPLAGIAAKVSKNNVV